MGGLVDHIMPQSTAMAGAKFLYLSDGRTISDLKQATIPRAFNSEAKAGTSSWVIPSNDVTSGSEIC